MNESFIMIGKKYNYVDFSFIENFEKEGLHYYDDGKNVFFGKIVSSINKWNDDIDIEDIIRIKKEISQIFIKLNEDPEDVKIIHFVK